MGDVAASFLEAARAYLGVFQLRGTEAPFPVTVLTIDPAERLGDPDYVIGDRPLHPSSSKDFSPTNSKAGLEAMLFALIGDDQDTATKIADLVWDPPNASYIGPTSEVCTPNEQHFAFGLKHLLEKNYDKAMSEISQLRTTERDGWAANVRTMGHGMVTGQATLFLKGLREELARHTKESNKRTNIWRPELYLSLYGLGLAILAVRMGVIKAMGLPAGDEFLPLELVPND
jgi:hypothetical protein